MTSRSSFIGGLRACSVVLALLGLACPEAETKPAESKSFWVRQDEKPRVIVFVHGVLGDARGTWTNTETGAFFPDLVAKEASFNDAGIFVAGFPSPALRTSYSIDQLTEKLYRDLENQGVLAYDDIVFVNHSMGGRRRSGVHPEVREGPPQNPDDAVLLDPDGGC